tara:strand:+ start:792 stop:1226 length:435 start_codon:yes stop_codon:yes gene_type:complete
MSYIGGPLPTLGSSSSSPSMTSVLDTAKNNPGKKEDGIEEIKRPRRMEKITEALEKAAAYKKQKEVDAEIDSKDDDTDNEMVGPKGFKVGSDSTVVTGYTDPGFTLQGVQGQGILGPVGAALSVFPKTAMVGRAVGAVGSLTGL